MLQVVREFANVFLMSYRGFPPHQEVDFEIEIIPGMVPMSIASSGMAPMELKELMKQFEELLDKEFIRPSTSPLRASVLFVKRRMVVCDYA